MRLAVVGVVPVRVVVPVGLGFVDRRPDVVLSHQIAEHRRPHVALPDRFFPLWGVEFHVGFGGIRPVRYGLVQFRPGHPIVCEGSISVGLGSGYIAGKSESRPSVCEKFGRRRSEPKEGTDKMREVNERFHRFVNPLPLVTIQTSATSRLCPPSNVICGVWMEDMARVGRGEGGGGEM